MRTDKIPRILVTMGEPAGIGPELIVKIAQQQIAAQIIVVADEKLLISTARALNLDLTLQQINWQQPAQVHRPGHLAIIPIELPEKVEAGKLNKRNATATLQTLKIASDLALQSKVDAIVTAPVHKANLNTVDPSFLGHTEYFANLAGVNKVVMMLAGNELRVTLATTHLPLAKVPEAITQASLSETIQVILQAFDQFNLKQPKLAVCGLNPHAGEEGLLGHEDQQTIQPVIQRFAQQGHAVFGPFPADTLFTPQKRKAYDVFLAMYHDQGLPVIKAFGFGECANITLGLPYIRTSVDHGTALEIAADYCASADSLLYAINYAGKLATGVLPS
ncbi:4-hydroxythreonine-4-phosphate dehydrogenase PdxA [Aliikangiella maris]|uniref:4-hydroxythreonine-4-phosphate dehydrogenase PdxA n=2 Tax=Aliikangiella maris TaxID=3162458 RepID=A0ABV3MLY2_9GAMM